MTYPRQTSMPMGIVFILCVRPSVQLSVSLDFGNEGKSLGCKSIHCGILMYSDDLSSVYLCLWVLLSVRLFTTFSGFFALADKSLGRNGIKFGMLMYPDDLSHTASMPMGIGVIPCVRPSAQLSMGFGFGITDKSLGTKVYILAH